MEPPGLRLICVAGCSQITDKGVQVSPCLSFSLLFSGTLFRLDPRVKTVKGRPFVKHQKTSSLSLYFGKSLEAESKIPALLRCNSQQIMQSKSKVVGIVS
jgi:hypothetical protein